MATFEQVVATNGAKFATPPSFSDGRYAYGTQSSSTYTYFTPRNDPSQAPQILKNALFCCNALAFDMSLDILNTLKSCFVTSVERVCTIPPQYDDEGNTRITFNGTVAIPVKPLLLRFKGDSTNASHHADMYAITCKSGNVDYYILKNAEFDIIKYIDITKHSVASSSLTTNFQYYIDENGLLDSEDFSYAFSLAPDSTTEVQKYNDLCTVYSNISIKFDYIVFSKTHSSSHDDDDDDMRGIHVVSAYGITVNIGGIPNYFKKQIGTVDLPPLERLEAVNKLLYNGLPGTITAYTKAATVSYTTPGGSDSTPTQTFNSSYRDITGDTVRKNHANYNGSTETYLVDSEVYEDKTIDEAVQAALPKVKGRSDKGMLYNCTMSMLFAFGFKDDYTHETSATIVDSKFYVKLYHNDIINTEYTSSEGSPTGDKFSLFAVHSKYLINPTDSIDCTAQIVFGQIDNYQFDPATLIDIIYKLRNDTTHFQFNKTTQSSGQVKATLHDYTGDDIEDTFKFIESNPSIQFTDSTPFITPMEYYSRGKTDFAFDDKVTNITSTEDEPNYFWIETLKNWGYFTINGQLSKDSNIVVDLLLWNGSGQWIDATAILDNVKKHFIPKRLYQYYIDRIKALAPHGRPATPSTEYDALNETINNMIAMIFARNSTIPFKFENVTTVDIERAYHNTNADYAVHSSKSWWEYIPIVYVAKGAWSGLKAVWNFSPAGMFYNAIWGDGIWEGIKSGYKDIFNCVYNWYGVASIVDLVELGIELFFSDNADPFISKLDPYQHLMSIARYIVLPYDESYSNNDSITLQTIRPDLVRYTNLEGGIINREPIIEYSVIPNVIGSPFVARSSTGELMIAYRMCYSGPVKEDADGAHDLIKISGIIEKDIEFSNKLLQDKLGKGTDKTALDMFNTYGSMPSTDLKGTATIKLPETVETAGVDRLSNQVQTTFGAITLKTNRSKTSSDLDSAEINTLTKW